MDSGGYFESMNQFSVLLRALLALVAFASCSLCQGTARLTYSAAAAGGQRTVTVDATAVTGGTVTITRADGTTDIVEPGQVKDYPLPQGGTVKAASSNGTSTMTIKNVSAAVVEVSLVQAGGGSAGPGLEIPAEDE